MTPVNSDETLALIRYYASRIIEVCNAPIPGEQDDYKLAEGTERFARVIGEYAGRVAVLADAIREARR